MLNFFFGFAIDFIGESAGYVIVLLTLLSVIFFGRILLPKVLNTVCFGFLSLYFINSGGLPVHLGVIALMAMTLIGGGAALVGFTLAGAISDRVPVKERKDTSSEI